MTIYTIKPGDTLYKISKIYGVSIDSLISNNSINDPDTLMIGQSLVIATNDKIYTVKSGDTLYKIAKNYGITISKILELNPSITNPDLIYPGQTIIISTDNNKLGTTIVNGYAFPGTSSSTLSNILPSLTYISIFSYQTLENGKLEQIQETRIINSSIQQGVAPLMVITNTRTGKGFDSDLASEVLNNNTVQDNLIQDIINILPSKRYKGVNIDFEYVYPEDKEAYNKFLIKLVNTLHPLGYIVTTAVAPKISDSQAGILYEAHDYKAQGEIVDLIIIMTYEWGYTYGPAQAVSPINQVEKVLKYAVSVIPSKKILMGMPNYGYNWTLPFVKGTAAQSLTNVQAINLATEVGANIQYDTIVETPFFEYSDKDGKEHIVWFDDARSIKAKLSLIDKYNLGGVSYWNINTYFPQNWIVLDSLYNVKKVL